MSHPIAHLLRRSCLLGTAALASLFATERGYAQSPCAALQDAYEGAVKEISAAVSRNPFDNASALQDRTDRAFYATLAQLNLSLLQANQCPMPTQPVTEHAYRKNAFDCEMKSSSRAERRAASKEPIPECARETWTRDAAK